MSLIAPTSQLTNYFTSCANALAVILFLPSVYNQTAESIRNLDANLLYFPALLPMRASHLPEPVLDRDDLVCKEFISFVANLLKSEGIIVNTFDSLEPRAVAAIREASVFPTVQPCQFIVLDR